jgi:hypothetical protein
VNEATQRIAANDAEQPQNEKNHENGPQHKHPSSVQYWEGEFRSGVVRACKLLEFRYLDGSDRHNLRNVRFFLTLGLRAVTLVGLELVFASSG